MEARNTRRLPPFWVWWVAALALGALLLIPVRARAQAFGGVFPGSGGGGGMCTLDGTQPGIATYYRATATTGTGFQCDATLTSCVDLGPGDRNSIGTNPAGDILWGPASGSTTTVRIFGNLTLNNVLTVAGSIDLYGSGGSGGGNLNNTFPSSPVRVTDADGLIINGTSAIKGVVRASVTFDFPSIPNGTCGVSSLTVTGAAVGDYVSINADFVLPTTVGIGNARVTATNTVDLRLCNHDAALSADPASGAYLVRLER